MCNLFSMTTNQQAIRDLAKVMVDRTGNLPPLPGVYPNMMAPIVRNSADGRELMMARWGMPTPPRYLIGKTVDRGVTNIRNPQSPHWRPWLDVVHRCVVPFTSFAEPEPQPYGSRPPAWFAFGETRPLAFFAGIWCRWTSVRKAKDGETTDDLFGFLTTKPNHEVRTIHPEAMPVILTTGEEIDRWMTAPIDDALRLQRSLPDGTLAIVARAAPEDPPPRQ